MGKESIKGTSFYSKKGLKTVTVSVPKETHQQLMKLAEEERSLQVTVRRILVNYFKRSKR